MKLIRFAAIGLFVFVSCSTDAAAQWRDAWGSTWNNPVSKHVGDVTYNRYFWGITAPKIKAAAGRASAARAGAGVARSTTTAPRSAMRTQSRPTTTRATTPSRSPARTTTATATRRSTPVQTPADNVPADNVLIFRPVANLGLEQELANSLSQKPDEREALLTLFKETKKAYNSEVGKTPGRTNNIAMAMTFFIATNAMVYRDAPEPSDAAIEHLYELIKEAVEENAASVPANREKQLAHDSLVYIGGIILAGYMHAKETGDAETLQQFRDLAATSLKNSIGIDPDTLSYNDEQFVIN